MCAHCVHVEWVRKMIYATTKYRTERERENEKDWPPQYGVNVEIVVYAGFFHFPKMHSTYTDWYD